MCLLSRLAASACLRKRAVLSWARRHNTASAACSYYPPRPAPHRLALPLTSPVQLADEAVCIGEAASSESYLSIPSIISAAISRGADAIHPVSQPTPRCRCRSHRCRLLAPACRSWPGLCCDCAHRNRPSIVSPLLYRPSLDLPG